MKPFIEHKYQEIEEEIEKSKEKSLKQILYQSISEALLFIVGLIFGTIMNCIIKGLPNHNTTTFIITSFIQLMLNSALIQYIKKNLIPSSLFLNMGILSPQSMNMSQFVKKMFSN